MSIFTGANCIVMSSHVCVALIITAINSGHICQCLCMCLCVYIGMYGHGLFRNLHTYVHTYVCMYIHTYIHTYVRMYIHTYIHACIHTYVRTYIHTYIHACMHMYIATSYGNPYRGNRGYKSDAIQSSIQICYICSCLFINYIVTKQLN